MYCHSTWSAWDKPGKVSTETVCVRAEIQTRNIAKKQEFQPLHGGVRWEQNYVRLSDESQHQFIRSLPQLSSSEQFIRHSFVQGLVTQSQEFACAKKMALWREDQEEITGVFIVMVRAFSMWFALLLLRRFSSITAKEEARKDPGMAVNSSPKNHTSGTKYYHNANCISAKC
jgi:hypothetical protein